MAFSASIILNELRTAFDAKTATLAANAKLGKKTQSRNINLETLSDVTALSARRFAWTQTDDLEVQSMALRVTDTTGGRSIEGALTVDGGDSRFILDQDAKVTLDVTSIIGTVEARPDLTLNPRFRLKKGVRYILTVTNKSAGTTVGRVHFWVQGVADRRIV